MYFEVRMTCGHRMTVVRPMVRERGCETCEPDIPRKQRAKRTVTHVVVDDQDVPLQRFMEMRRLAHANDLSVGERERRRVQRKIPIRRVGQPITHEDRQLIDWALNALTGRLGDVAQHMWAKGYVPGADMTEAILDRVALVNSERADALRSLLDTAENGIVPHRALYSQFGARAISQEVHGRPTVP